jgi:hypothetical protein
LSHFQSGQDLKEAGCPPGKMFSFVLKNLREIWKESDFKMDREALLQDLPKVMDDIDLNKSPKRQKLDNKKTTTKITM